MVVELVKLLLGAVALAVTSAASAQVSGLVDPLTAKVDDKAAHRFAEIWRASGGRPSATQLQSQYLDGGGRAIEVFTPGRIRNGEWLAKQVAENPQLYRDAVERCLPWVEATDAQLRATYLGFKGLFPNRQLPQIAVVVGADNSGGTAAPGIQVIGLEVICRLSPTRAEFEERMRQFFAHETVHTWQSRNRAAALSNPLVAAALAEGVPDYVTKLITARAPQPERDAWARSREEWIWRQFQSDAAIVKAGVDSEGGLNESAKAAYMRWFANAGDPPPGWPDELGYWVGMRIAEAYVTASPDTRAALEHLLNPSDLAEILQKSGYGSTFSD